MKPRDAAVVLFGLKLRVAKLRKPGFKAPKQKQNKTERRKTEFNAKWPFKVIQGHVFWSQWKGNQRLSNSMPKY